MASIKLLRDNKTGNVYECLLSDKGEIVQEHFIPASEVTKHPKFTATLEEKNIYNYFIPELLMKNPKDNVIIENINTTDNVKTIRKVDLYQNLNNSYSLVIKYIDNTVETKVIKKYELEIYSLQELYKIYPELKLLSESRLKTSFYKELNNRQLTHDGTNVYNEPVKKPFPKEIAIGLLTVISVLSLLYIIGEKFSV